MSMDGSEQETVWTTQKKLSLLSARRLHPQQPYPLCRHSVGCHVNPHRRCTFHSLIAQVLTADGVFAAKRGNQRTEKRNAARRGIIAFPDRSFDSQDFPQLSGYSFMMDCSNLLCSASSSMEFRQIESSWSSRIAFMKSGLLLIQIRLTFCLMASIMTYRSVMFRLLQ